LGLDADAAARKAWILDIRTAAPRQTRRRLNAGLRRDNRTLTPDPSVCRRAALDEGRVPEALPKGYPQHRGSFRKFVRSTKEPRHAAATRTGQRKVSSTYRNDCRAGTGTRRNRNRIPKLSTSYWNPMVKHVPELHNEQLSWN
jgi:hypothetical protein